MTDNKLYKAIATLVGITIGAGVLGIPYAVAKAGFLTGLISLVGIGIAMLCINLILGEVTLRTKKIHQLTGYAELYLGKTGKHLMAASMIFGIYGAIVAYTLGGGQTLAALFGGSKWLWSSIFFIIGATIIWKGLKALEESEYSAEIIKLSIFTLIIILAISSGKINSENLTIFNPAQILTPYGVVLFAYLATAAVPELREELKKQKKQLKKAIIIGSVIPMIVYTLFAFIVAGIGGQQTQELATITIAQSLGTLGAILSHLFALLAVFTSFIGLGYGLKSMYNYDYKISENTSWILTCLVPVIVILLGAHSFVKTIEITGAISGGIAGIITVLMHWKSQTKGERKPEYKIKLNWPTKIMLITLFILGALFAIKNLF